MHALLLTASLFLPSSTDPVAVWSVDDDGPADFAEIADAVAAASPGDVVVVADGSYHGFEIAGRSLTVVALPGAAVDVDRGNTGVVVRDLAAGDRVVLRGLRIRLGEPHPTGLFGVLHVHDNDGPVWIEDCEISGATGPGAAAVSVRRCEAVTLARCHVAGTNEESTGIGAGHGLFVLHTDLYLYESTFLGGDALGITCYPLPGGSLAPGGTGLAHDGGLLFSSGNHFRGGHGRTGCDGTDGHGCAKGGPGGNGVTGIDSGELHVLATTAEGGAGGPGGASADGGPPCPDGAHGHDFGESTTASYEWVAHDGPARALEAEAAVQAGGILDVRLAGAPGELACVYGSLDSGSSLWTPSWIGAIHLGSGFGFTGLMATLDDGGEAELQLPIPASIATSGQGLVLALQAGLVDAQAADPIHLSSPSHVVLLGAL